VQKIERDFAPTTINHHPRSTMVSSNMRFLLSLCFLALAIYLRAELRAQRRERLKQEFRQNQSAFQNEYNARLQEMQTRLNAYEQKQPWNSEAVTPTIAV
jgi:hypothetical protein